MERSRKLRKCPALGEYITARYCGEHRGVDIDCPLNCTYYRQHERYQRERLGPEFRRAWLEHTEPLYRENRTELLNFIVYLEALIYRYYREQARGSDAEIREALEDVRRQLKPVLIVETVISDLGKLLLQGIEEYMRERGLDRETALEGVENTLEFLDKFSSDGNRRRYLQGLIGHVEQDFELPEREPEEGIITPRIILPESLRRQGL